MNIYLLNIDEQPDGSLPVDTWIPVNGQDVNDAIINMLRSIKPRPEVIYSAMGTMRHDNGTPMAVQRNIITWGTK